MTLCKMDGSLTPGPSTGPMVGIVWACRNSSICLPRVHGASGACACFRDMMCLVSTFCSTCLGRACRCSSSLSSSSAPCGEACMVASRLRGGRLGTTARASASSGAPGWPFCASGALGTGWPSCTLIGTRLGWAPAAGAGLFASFASASAGLAASPAAGGGGAHSRQPCCVISS